MIVTRKSFCRFCHLYCGVDADVDVEKNRIVDIRGDKKHPVTKGYRCVKGKAELERIYHPERLLSSKKRTSSNQLTDIPPQQALDEIADRLQKIIDKYGPDAVAVYAGLESIILSTSGPWLLRKWMDAIGSRSYYTSYTIDCPNLTVAPYLFWGGPVPLGSFDMPNADVAMLIGTNPSVSHLPFTPQPNSKKQIKDARDRGMKLIVVDPRRCEIARIADMHLQVKPGEDATLLSAMIKVIIEEDLYDKSYVADYASGLNELHEAVRPFDLAYASRRTQVPAEMIRDAAVMFATSARGAAAHGTGIHMSRHPNLATVLIMTLNGLCGRWDRKGGLVYKPLLLAPKLPENPAPINVPLFTGLISRTRDIKAINNWLGVEEIPASCLTDDILTPGEGKIRALIVLAGNPALSFPDESSTIKALKDLDLLVVNDLFVNATARYADYVIGLKHPFEQADVTRTMDFYYTIPFMQYAEPVVNAPSGVLEGYEVFWELAKRLGVDLGMPGISMEHKPTAEDMMKALIPDPQVPLDEIRKHPGGYIQGTWEPETGVILPAMIGHPDKRMALAHPDVIGELREVSSEPLIEDGGYDIGEDCFFRLVNYRMQEVYCTAGHNIPSLQRLAPYNPVMMNRGDMDVLGLTDGDIVLLKNNFGSVEGIVKGTEDLRTGMVGMTYGWGDPGDARGIHQKGSNVQRLIPDDYRFDPVTGIALMTAIPVNVTLSRRMES